MGFDTIEINLVIFYVSAIYGRLLSSSFLFRLLFEYFGYKR